MNYETWLETYKPQLNHLNKSAPFEGLMYETYGEEFEFVMEESIFKVWTLVDDSEDSMRILPDYHYVNRLGYFVCEADWTDENLEVTI